MSVVDEIIKNQRAKVKDEVRKMLVKNAVDCTFYVAFGKVMTKELADKYGLTVQDAIDVMAAVAVNLVDKIRALPLD